MAKTVEFKYAPMFQVGEDKTAYRLLTKEGVSTAQFEGKEIVKVSKEALTLLAQQAFHDVEFMLRREHNEQVANKTYNYVILGDEAELDMASLEKLGNIKRLTTEEIFGY